MFYSFILPILGAILIFVCCFAILNTYEWIRDIDFRLKLVEGNPMAVMPDVYSMYSFVKPQVDTHEAEPEPETTVDVEFEEEKPQ